MKFYRIKELGIYDDYCIIANNRLSKKDIKENKCNYVTNSNYTSSTNASYPSIGRAVKICFSASVFDPIR